MKSFKYVLMSLILALPVSGIYAADVDPLFGDTIDRTAEDFVIASLCVAEPTNWRDDALGVYGHAFIRLQCSTFDMDYCFSYESESIKGQLWRYWRGKLKMGMFAIPTEQYIADYEKWGRGVHEYLLNMPPETEQRLWQIMDGHVAEGADLTLDLDERGCSSSAADYVIQALKPYRIHYDKKPGSKDFHVPAKLAQVWQCATLEGKPFAVYVGDLVEADPSTWWDVWFDAEAFAIAIAVLSTLIVIICRRRKKLTRK